MSGPSGHAHNTVLICPRCRVTLKEVHHGESHIDQCGQCGGIFFDQGELFGALGAHADPSYWDRPESAGPARSGGVSCVRCNADTLLQNVANDEHQCEIDRCGACGGVWLDAGEAETLVAVGKSQELAIQAEASAARAELASMGEVDFRAGGGLIAKFLALFKRG